MIKKNNAKVQKAKDTSKVLVRKKACRPPKEWFELSQKDYNPNNNPTALSPHMQKFVDGIAEGARKKEQLLIERITREVVKEITRRLEKGEIKIPEKKISFTISRDDLVEPILFDKVRERWLKRLFAPIQPKTKRSKKN